MTDDDAPDTSRASEIGRALAECIAIMEANREPEPFSFRRAIAHIRTAVKTSRASLTPRSSEQSLPMAHTRVSFRTRTRRRSC